MKKLITAVAVTGALFTVTTATHVSAEEYEVQKNDSLWDIADEYDISVDHLMDINGLDSNILHPGQKISTDTSDSTTQSTSETYSVVEGDTLSEIAASYSVTVDELKDWNSLSDSFITVGQDLKIKGEADKQNAEENQEKDDANENEEAKEETSDKNKEETAGDTFSVTATAYTAECTGCSGVTATGIDLKADPDKKVIAVDPDVIPLGSKVHVEGYGDAVAGDVGGAINGKKIDVHVPDEDEANSWGVKTVDVTVLD